MTRPITCAVVPRSNGTATIVTRNSRATASSVSGMTNDSSISTFAPSGSRPRQRSMPIANSTPSGMVMTVVMTPSLSVWTTAVCRLASCHTERIGSPQYQRIEKPCQAVRDLP